MRISHRTDFSWDTRGMTNRKPTSNDNTSLRVTADSQYFYVRQWQLGLQDVCRIPNSAIFVELTGKLQF